MKFMKHLLKFLGIVCGMALIVSYVPYGHYINAFICGMALWNFADF